MSRVDPSRPRSFGGDAPFGDLRLVPDISNGGLTLEDESERYLNPDKGRSRRASCLQGVTIADEGDIST